MLNKVIALGLLPLLVACNSSDSNNGDTGLPEGEIGIPVNPIEPGTPVLPIEPGTPVQPIEPETPVQPIEPDIPSKNPMYLEVAQYFTTTYEAVHGVCETDYSKILPVRVKYNLTCDWVDNESFVIIYTEFGDDGQSRGEYSTLMLTINHDYLNDQSIGFNAFLYYPTSDSSVTVNNFSFDITEQPVGWDYAKVNSFQFQSMTSNHDLLIKTDESSSSIPMSDLIGSDSKRFRLYSEVEIESGNASVWDNIANYGLFHLVHLAFRAS